MSRLIPYGILSADDNNTTILESKDSFDMPRTGTIRIVTDTGFTDNLNQTGVKSIPVLLIILIDFTHKLNKTE